MLRQFGITDSVEIDLSRWQEIADAVHAPTGTVTVGVVAKYAHKDAYNAETSDSIEKRIPLFDPMAYPMMW
ncbi:hypothetical protein SAMN05428997_112167 [Bosea sp. CRIB-10]|nr:hypothetical protein SAMN05428997_112167 [Bosea sp. CRIB-10]